MSLAYLEKQLSIARKPQYVVGDTTVPLTGMRTINMNLFAGNSSFRVVTGSSTTASCPPGFTYSTTASACVPRLQASTTPYTFISQSYQDSSYEEFGTRSNRWRTVPHGLDQKLVAVKFYPDDPDKLRDKCCYRLPYDMFTWKQQVSIGQDRHINEYRQLDPTHNECKAVPTIKMRGAGWGTDLDFCEEHSQKAFVWHKAVMDSTITYDELLWTKQKENFDIYNTKQAAFSLKRQEIEHEKRMRLLEADTKADKLLQKWLTPDEYTGLKEKGFMEYQSKKHSDTVYIIRKDYSRKITKRVKGEEVEELCVMPVTPLCNDDNLLSKIMLLKTDEDQFLKTANHFPLISNIRHFSNNSVLPQQTVPVDRNQ